MSERRKRRFILLKNMYAFYRNRIYYAIPNGNLFYFDRCSHICFYVSVTVLFFLRSTFISGHRQIKYLFLL